MSSDSFQGLAACSGTLMGLSMIAVGLRFYARKLQKVPYLADDWLVLPALFTYIGATITVAIGTYDRVLGYSLKESPPQDLEAIEELSNKLQIALGVLWTISLPCVKLSAVYFYRRVFCVGGPSRWFNWLTNATSILIVIWLIVFQFLTGFQCGTHLSASWDGSYEQYCKLSFPFLYGLTISDFIFDVWILVLPIPLILRLHATTAKKLSICGVLILAFAGLGASIARMDVLIQDELGGPSYFVTHDEERIETSYIFFVMMENGISLVAVNLPSLWFLHATVVPERVVRSIRSVLSLASRGSHHSSARDVPTTEPPLPPKVSSETSLEPQGPGGYSSTVATALRGDLEGGSFEAYAMHQVGHGTRQQPAGDLSSSAIHVQDTVELHHE